MVFFFLLFTFSAWPQSGLENFQLENLEGLLPSYWMDHTGFTFDDAPSSFNDIPQFPILPMLPLYKTGAFGRKTYVGAVIEEKYLGKLSRGELREVFRKIHEMPGPGGVGLRAMVYDGKIYAIRRDFDVILENSFTVGISIDFSRNRNSVVLGKSEIYGINLDFGTPFRMSSQQGINILGNLQKVIDDWGVGLRPDETQLIIDQSVMIAPVLLSYLTDKPLVLKDDNDQPLLPMVAVRNSEAEGKTNLGLETRGDFSTEFKKVMKDLEKNVAKETEWKKTVTHQVLAEKIISSDLKQKFLQDICDRIATVYDVPQNIWPKCRIASTLFPNAWAYPGGDIFISAGLLGIISDLDSLFLVLGHEIGHVVSRHGSKQALAKKVQSYAATIVSSAVNIGTAAFTLGGGWGTLGSVSFLSWTPQALASSVGSAYFIERGSELAAFAPLAGIMLFSREQEYQADLIGHEAAFASGAGLIEMVKGWEGYTRFIANNFPQQLGLKEKVMSGHPETKDRLANFEKNSHDLKTRLSDLNHANLIDQSLRIRYLDLHRSFAPYSRAYGRAQREKLEKFIDGKINIQKEHKLRHLMNTLAGQQSLCIRHALGAN
jgi:Zn-dependent protease with chaperone function